MLKRLVGIKLYYGFGMGVTAAVLLSIVSGAADRAPSSADVLAEPAVFHSWTTPPAAAASGCPYLARRGAAAGDCPFLAAIAASGCPVLRDQGEPDAGSELIPRSPLENGRGLPLEASLSPSFERTRPGPDGGSVGPPA